MFTRIVFATDFSGAAARGLRYAIDLSKRSGATLHLVHVVPGEVGYSDAPQLPMHDEENLLAELDQSFSEALDALPEISEDDLSIEKVLLEASSVAAAINRYASEVKAELVVIGTHGRRGVQRLLLGSVAEAVLRNATCDVLASRARAPERPVRKIVTPIDFSDHSKRAFKRAKRLGALYGADVQMLFVAEQRTVPVFSDTGLPSFSVREMDPAIVENAPRALRALDESVGAHGQVNVSHHVRSGGIDETIVEFATEEKADMVVLASHGISGAERRLLGNTTAQVLRTSSLPVYVVPARGLKS